MIPDIADILARLIAFPTVSRTPNLDLLDYVESLLRPAGVRLDRYASADGSRANLWASTGPAGSGGVVLSGHCDVVPVTGQDWSTDPFVLRAAEGRFFGRGTADMKGFLAVAIHTLLQAAARPLRLPLHLAISYDEEIGCLGVRSMLEARRDHPDRPALCLIGEPTGMRVATGHKGKRALHARCTGHAGHSALAPLALNALHLGAAFIGRLQARQDDLAATGARDPAYDVPYSTIHVGTMQGGTALNIVPHSCEMAFEIRTIAADDPDAIIAGLRADADAIAAPYRDRFPDAGIAITETSGYPGLDAAPESPQVALLQALLRHPEPAIKVAFGTEGGLFHDALGIPTLICGPGHMAQGHRPDEYVDDSQLETCRRMLAALVDVLVEGTEPAVRVDEGPA